MRVFETGTGYGGRWEVRAEGLWHSNGNTGQFPHPDFCSVAWPGERQWLDKLMIVEDTMIYNGYKLEDPDCGCYVYKLKELEWSGNSVCTACNPAPYKTDDTGAYWLRMRPIRHEPDIIYMWSKSYRHYIERHHIIPCREFYDLIDATKMSDTSDREVDTKDAPLPEDLFDRKELTVRLISTYTMQEGVWAREQARANALRPWPQANDNPWPGMNKWLRKLRYVENRYTEYPVHLSFADDSRVVPEECRLCTTRRMLAVTSHRLIILPADRQRYQYLQIRGYPPASSIVYEWPANLKHYIVEHNVVPSHEFYELIRTSVRPPRAD